MEHGLRVVLVLDEEALDDGHVGGEAEGGEDQDDDAEVPEGLDHDEVVLLRAVPVSEPVVGVGHEDRQQGGEGPDEEGVLDEGGDLLGLVLRVAEEHGVGWCGWLRHSLQRYR